MAWGDDLGGEGLVPDCLGWLRVVKEPKKAFSCKRWRGVEAALLRFPYRRKARSPKRPA